MSVTLSYGFIRPSDGDFGTTFWDQLADDITQLNSHSHNGIDSAKLTAVAITAVTQAITAAGWSATSGGRYRQLITVPASITFDAYQIGFTATNGASSGSRLWLDVEKVSTTTYYVYTIDNSLTLSALYAV